MQSPALGYNSKESVSLPQSEYKAIVRLDIKPNTQYLIFGRVNFEADVKDGFCEIRIVTDARTVPMSNTKANASSAGSPVINICTYYTGDENASYVELQAYRSGAGGKDVKVIGELRTVQINGYS